MLKEVVLASICLALISGCALMETSDVEVEAQSAAAPASDPKPEPPSSQAAVAVSLRPPQPASDESRNASSEAVKRIQIHLRDTGFYSGPVDGIIGATTQSAIRHFQSSCVTLKDLITNSPSEPIEQSSGMAAKSVVTQNRRGKSDAVRVIQLRLKDAGFDPGPIDGIHGAKTQSALLALNAGCMMLQDFSPMHRSEKTAGVIGEAPSMAVTDDAVGTLADTGNREAVRSMQTRLRDAGFDPGPIDGILGPKTTSALRRYQSSRSELSAIR